MRISFSSSNSSTRTSSAFVSSWPLKFAVLLLTLSGLLMACGEGTGGDRDGSQPGMDAARADGGARDGALAPDTGPPGCTSDTTCDDGIDCTEDTCNVSNGSCRHAVVPALCPAGSSCHPVRGCEMGRPCADDVDCEDDDACTVNERCDPAARVCVVDPLDGDGDGDPPRVCGGGDCDDSNPDIFNGALESCNGVDDDCDGRVDEGFNLAMDVQNCGTCGQRCGLGTCVDGACTCPPGTTACGRAGCVDTSSDQNHCGGCRRGCGMYHACREGMCTRCEALGDPCCPFERCYDYGGSSPIIARPLVCIDGACNCPADRPTPCPASWEYCVDLETDSANCGACENVCPSGTTCVAGACRCPAGQTLCDGRCVDLSTDSANCGSCGRSCTWPFTCVGGSCACPTGTTYCGGSCADLARDSDHCGACGNACAGWGIEECVGGACVSCGGAGEPCCGFDIRPYCGDRGSCDLSTGRCR